MKFSAILASRTEATAVFAAVAAMSISALIARPSLAAPPAQDPLEPCGPTTLTVERGGRVVFELPRQAGERFKIDPEEPITVRVSNVPAAGSVDVRLLLPFGQTVEQAYTWEGLRPGDEYVTTIDPADYGELARLVRGAYGVEIELRAGNGADPRPCVIPASVQVGSGVEGPVGRSALWGAVAAAIAAIGAAAWAGSNGAPGRPPVSRAIAAVVLGAIAGSLTSLALQQSGALTLTSAVLVLAALSGAVGAGILTILAAVVARTLRTSKP